MVSFSINRPDTRTNSFNSMHSFRFYLRLLLGAWLLTACRPTAPDVQPDPGPTAPSQGIPTEIGKPVGSPIQKTIGPAGGSISTADGALTLIIPAGALKEDTPIAVQPVENTAPGGTGLGYELSPKNLELAKPAELVWNYGEKDVQGSAPEALGLAVQQPDRTWLGRRNMTLNKAGRKASARVSKLQPAAFYEQYFMEPTEATVAPGETQKLNVYFQLGGPAVRDKDGSIDDLLTPLTHPELLKATDVKNWRVNGQNLDDRVDPQLGGLGVDPVNATATYLAPTRIPKQNQMAVSVEVLLKGTTSKLMLLSNLTVEGANGFQINGVNVDTAEVMSIVVAYGQLLQLGLAEKVSTGGKNQALVSLTIGSNFSGTGAYSVDDKGQVLITGQDRNRKSWSSYYHTRTGKKVVGPLTVRITEYDAQKKRVAGRFSGTLHHYDQQTDKHETASVSARFRATGY